MKTAIVFGASGMVGSHLLRELLNRPVYSKVTAVFRKKPDISHQKLDILIADYATLPDVKDQISADEVFIALGTTKKKTPQEKEYYTIDHDYPVLAARYALANGARSIFMVSSVGADVSSSIFYTRTKGETERDLIALGYEHTHIFQPSLLMGDRNESRPLEKAFMAVFPIVEKLFIGSMQNYKGIKGEDLALAITKAAENQPQKVKFYRWKEMQELLR